MITLTLLALVGEGTKCPDTFHIAIAFFSRKHVFLLFDFYYIGVWQFLVKKNLKFFGGTHRSGPLKIWKIPNFQKWPNMTSYNPMFSL